MANARATQGVTYAVVEIDPESFGARVTHAVPLLVSEDDAAARASQAVVYALTAPAPPSRISHALALMVFDPFCLPRVSHVLTYAVAFSTPCATYRCRCFRLTRLDGMVFAYTDHDQDVTAEGTTFKSCSSLSASATQTTSEADQTGDTQLTGLFSDDDITEADIFAGLFDGATVEIFEVSWKPSADPMSPRRLAAGKMGRVKQGTGRFTAEALSYGGLLQQKPLLETVNPHCRFELYSPRCALNRADFLVTGTVDGAAVLDSFTQSAFRVFADTSRAEVAGHFDIGKLTWLTGANAGLSSEVKKFEAGGIFTLWEPLPNPIALGDTYEVAPGCDFLRTTCRDKFNNVINFGGFDDVPGTDAITKTPDAKQ